MALALWDIANVKYQASPYPMVSLRIPGFNFECFDTNGNPKLSSILNVALYGRWHVFSSPLPTPKHKSGEEEEEEYFMDFMRLCNELFIFASSSECIMAGPLYNKKIPKCPLDMTVSLDNVGTHSFSYTCRLYACDSNSEREAPRKIFLYSETLQVVTVDQATRKKAQLPDWFLAKYKGNGNTNQGLFVKRFDRPAVTYAHPHKVRFSETDDYRHANFKSYLVWVIDALHAAIMHQNTTSRATQSRHSSISKTCEVPVEGRARRALHGISEEIIAHGICKTQTIYLRECLEGESVEIHVWQNEKEEKELVYFSIVKDGKDIFQMRMWFFDCMQEVQKGTMECKL